MTTPKLGNGSVTKEKIFAGAVTTVKIAAGAVTTSKLVNDAVTTSKLGSGAVTKEKLFAGAVTTPKLGDGSVTKEKLFAGAVTTPKLGDGSVTTSKLGADSVTAAQIINGAVTAVKLADGAITTAKIGDGAVTKEKVFAGAITTPKLADDSVTKAKIAQDGCTDGQILKLSGTEWVCATDEGAEAGNAVLSATQTFSGSNTFEVVDGTNSFLSRISLGGPVGRNLGTYGIEAVSIDGATQSSGCFVVVEMTSSADDATLTWTSTTTAGNAEVHGVLKEECAPGETCFVQLTGILLATVNDASLIIGNACQMSTTRCRYTQASLNTTSVGCKIMGNGAPVGENDWVRLY